MKSFDKLFPFFLAVGILLNFNGLLIDILEPDGALYATISKHMALTGDWTNLWGDGHDWLDKPHLPFWISAISFKVFGINAFAYKLPAFLFWLGGIWFTYRLAVILYNEYTAKVAAILYVFSLHTMLNNFDVRAEPYLMTLSVGAIYYFYKAHLSGTWKHITIAAFLCACSIMTKGIFVLITIGGGFVIWWMVSRQWKQFVNYRWYVMIALILVFISPELYSLYTQFDLHPEKVVFGTTHVSGLRFFFWDSQFGRFFNTGPIKGNGDKTFFLHTTLWAYLPWAILLYCAVIQLLRNGKLSPEKNCNRWVIYGSTVITFLLFSLSGFQLPHYITILFPQFSIITAAYLTSLKKESSFTWFKWLQLLLLMLGGVAIFLLSWYSKIGFSITALVIVAIIFITTIFYFRENGVTRVVGYGVALSVVLFIYLFNFFYPQLLTYQAGMEAGKWLQKNKPQSPAALLTSFSYSFEFYAPGYVETIRDPGKIDSFVQQRPSMVYYTTEKTADELTQKGYRVNVLNHYPYFAISMLDKAFINPATRNEQLEKMCIIEIKKIDH